MTFIVTRTPYRVSFFGGGTDYPNWYRENGGAVLSTTINKYCYVTVKTYSDVFDIAFRVIWRHVENVDRIEEILNPPVRGALKMMRFTDRYKLEIHYQGDLPSRSGIGSSSAFAVGLIKALSSALDPDEELSAHELALKAIELEQVHLNEIVGSQDQMAAAHGGLNHFQFLPSGEIVRKPVPVLLDIRNNLENHLMMFYTGTQRYASRVAERVVENMRFKHGHLSEMHSMVDQAVSLLSQGDVRAFGKLLHEAWLLKRELATDVTNANIDNLYAKARAAGAYGGKLMGAGKAGFLIFIVPPDRRDDVKAALQPLRYVPISLDDSGCSLLCRSGS